MKNLVIKVLQQILLTNQYVRQRSQEMSLNTINMMGNLTRDPEIKHIPSGKEVCNFSIANNRITTKNGEKTTEVSYFDVEVWGTAAMNCHKYLVKGSGIIVEGRLRQERWEKDGKTQSRIKIAADAIHFLPKKQNNPAGVESPLPSPDKLEEELMATVSSSEEVS